jgi:chaperonin GroEL
MLEDMAILTAGQVISEDLGIKLENVTHWICLGSAKKIRISKDETIIVDGSRCKKPEISNLAATRFALKSKKHLLTMIVKNCKSALAKLAGGVAVIRVGGATEVEVKERKDRVDDAMHATRAAVEEGIVPGGGVALLYASRALDGLKGENPDQQAGIEIIRRAIQSPIRQIVENAGKEGSIIVGKLLEQKDPNYGYDAQKDEYVDMVKAGIIDPVKVVRIALQNAVSVAGLMVTTEAMICDMPKEDKASAGASGMGGMGDMDF